MKIEVRYFTKTGHTKKLAEGIANQLGVCAKPISDLVEGIVDVLFLGEGLYSFDIDEAMKEFIKTLHPSNIKMVIVFSSGAFGNAYAPMKRELEAQGLNVSLQEFHCKGNLGFMFKNRPNEKDVYNAAVFAKTFIAKMGV
ncbi:flavodoxin [Alkalibaculum sporogenes]|nr:flavodoxin [Alkalibaculum sporogenes]